VILVSVTRLDRARRRERREASAAPTTAAPTAPGAPDYGYLLGLFLLFSLGVVMVYSTKAFQGGWKEMA
jgi:hypothetical protein